MTSSKEWNCLKWTWVVIFTALLARLILSSQFLLIPDEANYWQWSRYLALGYHDHPPMIAWTIYLSTKIFGQNEFAVRLPTILGMTIASVYLALLAGRWFSWRCALHMSILSQGILLFNGTALLATPDGVLLPCWAAACYHAARASERGEAGQWLLTGVWFGLGLLSKYTMVLFLPSLLFYLLFSPEHRKQLLAPAPWIGLCVGCLLFTPVIIWNRQNEWVTFRHVLYMGGADGKQLFTLHYIGDYFASQAALLSPLVFILIIAGWMRRQPPARFRNDDLAFLTWMSLTTFLVFWVLSLHSRVYGNWSAPAYLTAMILVAALYSPGRAGSKNSGGGRRFLTWKFAVVTAYLLSLPVLVQVAYPILPLSIDLDRTARETSGWKELGQAIEQELAGMKHKDKAFIFGLRYQIASELAFYVPGQPRTVCINHWSRPNVYDFWFDDSMLKGRDAIGVSRDKEIYSRLAGLFKKLDPPKEFKIYRNSPWYGRQLVRTLYIFKGYSFKGGQRWQPQNSDDIRINKMQVAE